MPPVPGTGRIARLIQKPGYQRRIFLPGPKPSIYFPRDVAQDDLIHRARRVRVQEAMKLVEFGHSIPDDRPTRDGPRHSAQIQRGSWVLSFGWKNLIACHTWKLPADRTRRWGAVPLERYAAPGNKKTSLPNRFGTRGHLDRLTRPPMSRVTISLLQGGEAECKALHRDLPIAVRRERVAVGSPTEKGDRHPAFRHRGTIARAGRAGSQSPFSSAVPHARARRPKASVRRH